MRINAKAVIVPHHLLAAKLIHEALGKISPDMIKTVVLIGPNHLNLGTYPISTTQRPWKTVFGDIQPDLNLIGDLFNTKSLVINDPVFVNEHSICGLVTFVKIYFPEAKIVALAVKSNPTDKEMEELGGILADKCIDCLVMGSVDFSHGVNNGQTLVNDKQSIRSLRNLKEMDLNDITADSLPAIQLINYYLGKLNITRGNLINNSNSYEISGKDKDNLTSYITIIY